MRWPQRRESTLCLRVHWLEAQGSSKEAVCKRDAALILLRSRANHTEQRGTLTDEDTACFQERSEIFSTAALPTSPRAWSSSEFKKTNRGECLSHIQQHPLLVEKELTSLHSLSIAKSL